MNDMSAEKERRLIQLRKGILELAIMGILYGERHYGYSLVRVLNGGGEMATKEGTIYPILSRLAREGLVESVWVESEQGPPRKYYSLTPAGKQLYEVLIPEFDQLVSLVKRHSKSKGKAAETHSGRLILGTEEHHV